MADKRDRTKQELKKLVAYDFERKGLTEKTLRIMIDRLWPNNFSTRTSGFGIAGSPDAEISWNDATRTFTIAPIDPEVAGYTPNFAIYAFSSKPIYLVKKSSESIQLPNEEGLFAVYYDSSDASRDQHLVYKKNPTFSEIWDIYLRKIIAAWIYWDASSGEALYFGDSRHGSEWNPQMHWTWHRVWNALREEGVQVTDIEIGDGNLDRHAQVGITAGKVWDDDIFHETNALGYSTGLPILYKTATGPRFVTRTGFPVTGPANQRLYFNNGNTLQVADDGRFVYCHIFWTNCQLNEYIAVMGQAQYDEATEAIDGYSAEMDYIDEWIPHQSKLLVASLLYETSDDFANDVKARIVGEMSPEGIADLVSEDNIPAKKTGWNPAILEHVSFNYTEASHDLTIQLETDFTTYFIQGIKHKLILNLWFNNLPEDLGKKYISASGNSFSTSSTKWDEHTTEKVLSVELYRNPRQSQTQFLGWRMHTWEMDGRTRGNILKKTGLEILSGFDLSVNDTNAHEIDVADGSFRLADIIGNVVHNSGNTFGQTLRSLQARRHYLKTYTDNTDPENPIITHEWEYQDTPAANVANLSAGNEVQINELSGTDWVLTETADGDYTAVWLILCPDALRPLKWFTGAAADADLETAKELNNEASIKAIIDATTFITDHYQVLARVMIKNIADAPYYELLTDEIQKYDDGEFDTLTNVFIQNLIDVNIEQNNSTEITNIVNNYITENNENTIPEIIDQKKNDYKESFIIENTVNVSETQVSSWSVAAFNEVVGEFKAVVMVRNKNSHTIVTLMNILSFDYTNPANEVSQDNPMLTDGTITLSLGIDGSNKLFATVANMPADAKRIHFCFERCVLGQRSEQATATMGLNIGMAVSMAEILTAQAQMGMSVGMAATLQEVVGTEPVEYALLYNYYTIQDARNIANTGWHVPTEAEAQTLESYLGGFDVAGGKLKETGTSHWSSPNTGATNSSGFTGKAGGFRIGANFYFIDSQYIGWLDTVPFSGFGKCMSLHHDSDDFFYANNAFNYGCSVPLVKDSTGLSNGQTGTYTGNDGKVYPTICIGTQEWLLSGLLKETKYRNGDAIPEITDGTLWSNATSGALCAYNNDWGNA